MYLPLCWIYLPPVQGCICPQSIVMSHPPLIWVARGMPAEINVQNLADFCTVTPAVVTCGTMKIGEGGIRIRDRCHGYESTQMQCSEDKGSKLQLPAFLGRLLHCVNHSIDTVVKGLWHLTLSYLVGSIPHTKKLNDLAQSITSRTRRLKFTSITKGKFSMLIHFKLS